MIIDPSTPTIGFRTPTSFGHRPAIKTYNYIVSGSTVMPMLRCSVGKAFRKKIVGEVYENEHIMYENVRNSNFYSVPKLLKGFETAAFITWKLPATGVIVLLVLQGE